MEVLKMTLGDDVSSRVDIVDGCVCYRKGQLCLLCFLCFCKKKEQEFNITNIQARSLVSEIETISSTYKKKGNNKQSVWRHKSCRLKTYSSHLEISLNSDTLFSDI